MLHNNEKHEINILKIKQNDIDNKIEEISSTYHQGGIVVIEDFQFQCSRDIFSFKSLPKLDMDAKNFQELKSKYKKTKSFEKAAMNVYPTDEKNRENLVKTMYLMDKQIQELFCKIFKDISIDKNKTSWRFSKTENEDYHADVFNDFILRAFVNLSNENRVWGIRNKSLNIIDKNLQEFFNYIRKDVKKPRKISLRRRLRYLYEKYLGLLKNEKYISKGKLFRKYLLETKVVNNFVNQKLAEINPTKVEFEYFDLWMCDSQKVAHQIIGGDKLVSFSYTVRNISRKKNILEDTLYINEIEKRLNSDLFR